MILKQLFISEELWRVKEEGEEKEGEEKSSENGGGGTTSGAKEKSVSAVNCAVG